MRFVLALAVLLAVAGCDAFSDDGPAWTEVGAVATFDYTPGPDSLSVLGPGRTPPFRRAPATARAVEMRVVRADRWDYTDRRVEWGDPGGPDGLSRFDTGLPMRGDDVEIGADGLTVTVAHDCPDLGLRRPGSAESSGPLTFTRVPRAASGAFDVWGDCTRNPLFYRAVRTERVTVPAGTFEAVVIEGPAQPDGTGAGGVEWWSWEVGLVRYDVLRYDGVLQGRFERSASP